MKIATKVGVSVLAVSSVAGFGHAGNKYLERKEKTINTIQPKIKISDLIEEKYDYILLDATSPDKDWETNWNTYKQDNLEKETDIFNLGDWPPTDAQDLKSEFKKRCASLAKESILKSDVETYENVTKYCARSVTIADQARKKGLKILNAQKGNKDDYNTWAKRGEAKGALNKELELLKVKEKDNAYSIQAGCETIITINKKEPKYEDIFKAYEKVCTRRENDPK